MDTNKKQQIKTALEIATAEAEYSRESTALVHNVKFKTKNG